MNHYRHDLLNFAMCCWYLFLMKYEHYDLKFDGKGARGIDIIWSHLEWWWWVLVIQVMRNVSWEVLPIVGVPEWLFLCQEGPYSMVSVPSIVMTIKWRRVMLLRYVRYPG